MSENHKAIVAQVESTFDIPGADKIHVAVVLGEQVIVSKEVGVGYVGILFLEGLQLSEEYCHHNNLFRDKEKNADKDKAGFFEASRRVRAQPFLKVKSTAYFAAQDSLHFVSKSKFMVGEKFDTIGSTEICRKYISPETQRALNNAANAPKKTTKQVFSQMPYFEKHVDTAQFKHSINAIPVGAKIYFHAKVHGTSARMSNTLRKNKYPVVVYKDVKFRLPGVKKQIEFQFPVLNLKYVANRLGKLPDEEWVNVVGTRNTLLNTPEKDGFHGSESFRFDVLKQVEDILMGNQGMTIYGEIAGFANNAPIMATHSSSATKDKAFKKKYGEVITYKYGCKPSEYRFHVYRITTLQDGENIDCSQEVLDNICGCCGLLPPTEVHPPVVYDGNAEALLKLVEELTERPALLGEDYIDPSHPGEGVVLRVEVEGKAPKFYKNKSYFFKVLEGHTEAIDYEDAS